MRFETDKQSARRLRVLIAETKRQAQYSRARRLDHYRAREFARQPPDVTGESHAVTKSFTNVCLRYCGMVLVWVGYHPHSHTFEGRVEGYPTVTDIAIHVHNPSSSKSLTRAAQYTLAFLEQHLGTPVYGSIKLPDGRYAVTVSAGHAASVPSD